MSPESFNRVLRAFHRRSPFRSFSVKFVSGAGIDADHPEALVFRSGIAVFVSKEGVPTLFDHESVSEVIGETEQAKPS
jgi:hypothetical protein